MSMRHLLLFCLPLVCGWGAHQFQVSADMVRRALKADNREIFIPSPKATQVAAMGFDLVVADLLWVRSVLIFVDFLGQSGTSGAVWMRTVLQTVVVLDPAWRTPFFYGGGMLRMLDDVEGSDEIFTKGMEAFPEDAYFPFSIGMNAFLIHKDLDKAAAFLKQAGALPSAPRWYRAAAAEFLNRRGQRKAALMYLKQEIESANSERERVLLENKFKSLLYEQIVEVLVARQKMWEAKFLRPLDGVEGLGDLPPDPLGGAWFVAADGIVRSTVQDPVVAKRARNEERSILVNP